MLDGCSEDSPMTHVAGDGQPVDRRHFPDAFGLLVMLFLHTLVDSMLLLLESTQEGLGCGDELVLALIRLIEFVLVTGAVLVVLSGWSVTIEGSMPLGFLWLRHSAVTLA